MLAQAGNQKLNRSSSTVLLVMDSKKEKVLLLFLLFLFFFTLSSCTSPTLIFVLSQTMGLGRQWNHAPLNVLSSTPPLLPFPSSFSLYIIGI